MAHICYKNIKCEACPYYKYDKDNFRYACFAYKEQPIEEYIKDIITASKEKNKTSAV